MTTSARQVIVNADDFGLSPGVNRGVIKAFEEGVVTSASLMVRPPWADEAAAYARDHRALSLGLHVDLGEWTLRAGQWVPLYEVVALDDADAVLREVRGQLDAYRSMVGSDPAHLDSHQHVHRNGYARTVLEFLANELCVPLRHFSNRVRYLGDFYGQDEQGISHADWIDSNALTRAVTGVKAGVTELCCHPAAAADVDTLYMSERLLELDALCDPRVRAAVAASGVQLVSFGEQANED